MAISPLGQALDDALPSRLDGVVLDGEAAAQDGVDDLPQMPLRDGGMTVAIRDHFALLGQAQPSLDGARGLSQDGEVGRPAAPADGPTPAVEDLHGDARAPA